MRLPLVSLGIGIAIVVAAGCSESRDTESSCAAAVRWNQTLYFGQAMKAPHGPVLGQGVVPPCTSDDEGDRVTVRRVVNVPPALALARDGVPNEASIYLAPGFFPVLADHPLHRALVRHAGGFPRPRGCSERFRLTGAVESTPRTDVVTLRSDRGRASVNLVTRTKIVGFRRAGYAYLQARDLVDVRGRRCDLPDRQRAYVAELIAPAN